MADHKAPKLAAVLMAGGSGTRFWPASTKAHPKQYLPLAGKKTLIEETVDRVKPLVGKESIFICTTQAQSALVDKCLPDIAGRIYEPMGMNTAPCLMLSTAHLIHAGYSDDTVCLILAADHYIPSREAFAKSIELAAAVALETGGLVTLGIAPTHPHTGYGYIQIGPPRGASGDVFEVNRFVEKPTLEKAQEFLQSKSFCWNSGMFVWTLGAIRRAFEKHTAGDWAAILGATTREALSQVYAKVKPEPIDIAILEKEKPLYMVRAHFEWSDVGSWNAIHALHSNDSQANVVISGQTKALQTQGCLVQVDPSTKLALVGVDGLIIVQRGDTLLIASRDSDQQIREIARQFEGN